MAGILWKVRANKDWSSVRKGMEVEIIVENRTGKPYIKDIMDALVKKYNIKAVSGAAESLFDFTKC